jgi:UDP-glucose 4-epimerase
MKIIITGGGGFIGSHLSELLYKNHELVILSRLEHLENLSSISSQITFEKCDVVDTTTLGQMIEKHMPDLIIHLAGETSHSKSFENPLYDLDVNAKSTLFILEKIRTLNLKCRFMLGSTFIVIGKPESLPVNEDTKCNPTTIYGNHRLTSENYCKIYSNVFDLDTVIFRITNSYGPREKTDPKKNAINFLINEASQGNDVTIFNEGNYFRDLIYVKDVVDGIFTLIKKGKSGELYWISSFEKTWFKDFGKILKSLTNANVTYVESPNYTKKVDVGNFVVDNTKLQKLGWTPKFSLKSGIKETLNYLNSSKSL